MMELVFEWNTQKARLNVQKHGISFEEAKTVFRDPLLLTYVDELHSETEERYISIGRSGRGRTLLVVHTETEIVREHIIRIISSRNATTTERKTYENERE
jgi:uncharacterized DUF497 family protein